MVANAQNSNTRGWKSNDGMINRYWLVNNLLNKQYSPIRKSIYEHHRLGLDKMYDDNEGARKAITESLNEILKAHRTRPGSMLMQVYLNAKSEEYVKIFKTAPAALKAQVLAILLEVDPTNGQEYRRINE